MIGSSSAPFVNSLAHQYGLATQYYANTHPSIGNYFMLTTGRISSNDDAYTGTVMADNIVRHLLTAGKTWKAYQRASPVSDTRGLICIRTQNGTTRSPFSPMWSISERRPAT